ncbi:MAG: hypothetical protein COW26_03450 [Nitrosopumilales archaeon CG15_BIG_FIL_POST_REV_8_21_14_020_33_23]|nr:MAG: hypothetical protein COW26_03450 [Nitrosopumilales archaeon CG15_BIG_FIL_POST_REV_8_21_14_020_33_23]
MFVGGADVSGDKRREGERNYIAFLVGTKERINKIYDNIGIDGIHMSELSDPQREQVRRNLDFKHNDVRAWCFHVQRQHIEDYFIHHSRLKNPKLPKISIHKNFDHYLLRSIKDDLEKFVFPYHQELSDIVVQTDWDMKHTIEHWKMQRVDEGIAFQLADAIAWFNQKHIRIDNCKDMDLRDYIKSSMEQDLLR